MDGLNRVRVIATSAELMGLAAVTMLTLATMQENWRLGVWGLAAGMGAASAAVCAVVICAAGKSARRDKRQWLAQDVSAYLRAGERNY